MKPFASLEGGIPLEIVDRMLIESTEPWTAYNALKYLAGLKEDAPDLIRARAAMLSHPNVAALTESLEDWPGRVISSHKSAWQPYHRLAFAADIGLTSKDEGVKVAIGKAMSSLSSEGLPELPVAQGAHSPAVEPGTMAWAACDAPTTLYALSCKGLAEDPRVRKGLDYLLSLARPNGWGCTVSPKLGGFRGPGRKSDPCPYVNLIMLKLISAHKQLIDSPEAGSGVDCLLRLWERSLDEHPYIFWMGTDFRKLKAPFIWYDILHVAEVLTRFPSAHGDPRLRDMLDVINAKAGHHGMFTAESAWQPWKAWDFGQTRLPSSWMSLRVRIMTRRLSGDLP